MRLSIVHTCSHLTHLISMDSILNIIKVVVARLERKILMKLEVNNKIYRKILMKLEVNGYQIYFRGDFVANFINPKFLDSYSIT